MTFKQFVAWCNDRACDGCWGPITAMTCVGIIERVRKSPFWKREKVWQSLNTECEIIKEIVEPVNEKIRRDNK